MMYVLYNKDMLACNFTRFI